MLSNWNLFLVSFGEGLRSLGVSLSPHVSPSPSHSIFPRSSSLLPALPILLSLFVLLYLVAWGRSTWIDAEADRTTQTCWAVVSRSHTRWPIHYLMFVSQFLLCPLQCWSWRTVFNILSCQVTWPDQTTLCWLFQVGILVSYEYDNHASYKVLCSLYEIRSSLLFLNTLILFTILTNRIYFSHP